MPLVCVLGVGDGSYCFDQHHLMMYVFVLFDEAYCKLYMQLFVHEYLDTLICFQVLLFFIHFFFSKSNKTKNATTSNITNLPRIKTQIKPVENKIAVKTSDIKNSLKPTHTKNNKSTSSGSKGREGGPGEPADKPADAKKVSSMSTGRQQR